jgi:branched-subunit amino acid ABC-type transport system permease component
MTSASALAVLGGLLATLGLLAFMQRSLYGRAWRAVSDDAGMAALCGVSERAVLDKALILAAALAGLAGILVTALYGGVGFAGGFSLGLKALIAAILGGIGSITGAVLGDLVLHAALVVVLVFRPGGLFGFPGLSPRRV